MFKRNILKLHFQILTSYPFVIMIVCNCLPIQFKEKKTLHFYFAKISA